MRRKKCTSRTCPRVRGGCFCLLWGVSQRNTRAAQSLILLAGFPVLGTRTRMLVQPKRHCASVDTPALAPKTHAAAIANAARCVGQRMRLQSPSRRAAFANACGCIIVGVLARGRAQWAGSCLAAVSKPAGARPPRPGHWGRSSASMPRPTPAPPMWSRPRWPPG